MINDHQSRLIIVFDKCFNMFWGFSNFVFVPLQVCQILFWYGCVWFVHYIVFWEDLAAWEMLLRDVAVICHQPVTLSKMTNTIEKCERFFSNVRIWTQTIEKQIPANAPPGWYFLNFRTLWIWWSRAYSNTIQAICHSDNKTDHRSLKKFDWWQKTSS